MKFIIRSCLLLLFILLSACSSMHSSGGGESIAVDSLRGAAPYDRQTKTIPLNREQYSAALNEDGAVNTARLVQIFHRGNADTQLKEYRLLDVRSGSVYEMLGLRSADVVVAANGFVVPTPPMFWNYLRLMAQFDRGSIEIRRGGTPILFEYTLR